MTDDNLAVDMLIAEAAFVEYVSDDDKLSYMGERELRVQANADNKLRELIDKFDDAAAAYYG